MTVFSVGVLTKLSKTRDQQTSALTVRPSNARSIYRQELHDWSPLPRKKVFSTESTFMRDFSYFAIMLLHIKLQL